jgi:hypothetical protein
MKRLSRVLFLGALLGLAASPVMAHGGGVHLKGTVSSIGADHLIVKEADGHESNVKIDDQTRFVRGASPAKREDIEEGERVIVHARKHGGGLEATEVHLAGRRAGTRTPDRDRSPAR